MKTSVSGIYLIQSYESCCLEAYQTAASEPWTIGWGHTKEVCEGDTCTQNQADLWLEDDLVWVESAINRYVSVPLSQNMFDALASWVYNLGETKFLDSTMLVRVNEGDFVSAAHELTRWYKTPGFELGLSRRRFAEASLFLAEPMP